MFRALGERNYRLFFAGQVLSNSGTWMQRVAQDWLVLDLSGSSGTALGITTGLQFLPYLLLSLWGGKLADKFDRRRLLMITQALMGLLALVLGLTTLHGSATVYLVYAFAFALGLVSAVDNPTRQAFVHEIVDHKSLHNAISLNSASFNLARLLGPAIAGLMVAAIGSGWVFLVNAVSFGVTIGALMLMRRRELREQVREEGDVRLMDGFRFVRTRPDLVLVVVIIAGVAAFGLNFQITMALIARQEFGLGAAQFGFMSTSLAVGAICGSLMAARRHRATLRAVVVSGIAFGIVTLVIGLSPNYEFMLVMLPLAGGLAMTFTTSTQSFMQIRSEPWVRGRIMGIFTLMLFGGTPFCAALIGVSADMFGARSGLVGGGIGSIVWTVIAVMIYLRHRARTRPDEPAWRASFTRGR